MLQNQLMQWQYVNARADVVKEKMTNQVENNLLYAWDTITNLEHLVLHKKLQLHKERLEMKQLDFILMSQAGKTISLLFELADAIAQEKLLMEECS
ncbi:hypothetical protein Pint_30321 [Pistacia integerrima]|uniref:Uncharacterized protein n=1 Tax=Pistacia integerrima TaxID=434235 RepID=A0ACC0WX70_9ROSI|nr:hypothetical protein Pint_30321 [Pistacia integerrima]